MEHLRIKIETAIINIINDEMENGKDVYLPEVAEILISYGLKHLRKDLSRKDTNDI